MIRSAIRTAAEAARKVTRDVLYAALNGQHGADLRSGRLVLASQVLEANGYDQDFTRRYSSPFGRVLAKTWRALTGSSPIKVWVKRDTRWLKVMAYPAGTGTGTDAIAHALATYPRTAA